MGQDVEHPRQVCCHKFGSNLVSRLRLQLVWGREDHIYWRGKAGEPFSLLCVVRFSAPRYLCLPVYPRADLTACHLMGWLLRAVLWRRSTLLCLTCLVTPFLGRWSATCEEWMWHGQTSSATASFSCYFRLSLHQSSTYRPSRISLIWSDMSHRQFWRVRRGCRQSLRKAGWAYLWLKNWNNL